MSDLIEDLEIGQKAKVRGMLVTVQEHKKFYIMKITDSTKQDLLQLIFDLATVKLFYRDQPVETTKITDFSRGLHVEVTGMIVKPSAGREAMEMQVESATYYGTLDAATYPFPKLKKGEKQDIVPLRQQPWLRFRSSIFQRIMRIRHTSAKAVHDFFDELGLLWLHTPILTVADCEGAGETMTIRDSDKFFGKAQDVALTVSGQLHGEAGAVAMTEGIYTFGPTFRAEKSHTSRHLAEFWMIEPEQAWLDLKGLVHMATHLPTYVMRKVLEKHHEDLEELGKHFKGDKRFLLDRIKVCTDGFKEITYTDAISRLQRLLAGSAEVREACDCTADDITWGIDLSSDMEKSLVKHYGKPVVVTHYPKELKSFYMYADDDCEQGRETVQAMDVLFPDIGEMIGGSVREYRHEVLKARMEELGISIDWYLQLREMSTVPHAGYGLGFERLVMYITGAPSVHDVIPFPRQYQGMHC